MKFDVVGHLALALYVLVGYVSAYHDAKGRMEKYGSTWLPGPLSRLAAKFLVVMMPVLAILAFLLIGTLQSFLQLIGNTMNVGWFWAGCLAILAKKRVPAEQTTTETLKVRKYKKLAEKRGFGNLPTRPSRRGTYRYCVLYRDSKDRYHVLGVEWDLSFVKRSGASCDEIIMANGHRKSLMSLV